MRPALVLWALVLTSGTAGATETDADAAWQQLVDVWSETASFEATIVFWGTTWNGAHLPQEVYWHVYADMEGSEYALVPAYGFHPRAMVVDGSDAQDVYAEDRRPQPMAVDPTGIVALAALVKSGLAACSSTRIGVDRVPTPVVDGGRYHWRQLDCPGQKRPTYMAFGFAPEDTSYTTPILDRVVFPAPGAYATLMVRGVERGVSRPAWWGPGRLDAQHMPTGALSVLVDPLASPERRAWDERRSQAVQGILSPLKIGSRPVETLDYRNPAWGRPLP